MKKVMAQSNMKLQVLILLATTLTISCGQYGEEIAEVFVESGSVAVLPCQMSVPDVHSPAVQWKRESGGEMKTVWRRNRSGMEYRSVGTSVRAYCPQPNFSWGEFSLHLSGVTEKDGGMYHCVVEGMKKHTRKVMLRIVRVSFTPAEVVEGNSMTVSCNITPQPDRVKTTWEVRGSLRATSQSLTFQHVSQKESGSWSCLVNSDKASGKASASLQVKGILNPEDNSKVVYAEVGSSVTLPCVFSSGLFVSSVSWNKVFNAADLSTTFATSSKIFSGLYFESVVEENEGIYKCSGQVEGVRRRSEKMERYIHLVTAQILSSSISEQLSLSCELSNSSRVTHYEWLRLDYGENETQTLSTVQNSPSKVLKIPKGEERHRGGWVCRFYEHQTLLGNATYHQPMMSGLEGMNKSENNRKIITIIGLTLVALLVFLILLQMYKNHRRRKMIMQYPAMETIVHLASNERERIERSNRKEKECSVDLKSISV
uniref:Neural cell adhesion molecule L1.1-like n=1 Tax=Astyanax mexicanus TaxID=7994 RepID=W5LI26_ASTMX